MIEYNNAISGSIHKMVSLTQGFHEQITVERSRQRLVTRPVPGI
jgi:hypothetical protein